MYNKKKIYIIFMFLVYLIGCQSSNLKDKNAKEAIGQTDIMEDYQEKKIFLQKDIELIPLEEDEGLNLEIEYSETTVIPDTFIIYTTKGREFFRLIKGMFFHHNKYIKYFWDYSGLTKGMIFPYIDFAINGSSDVSNREGLCFVDGKNGKVKLFSFDVFITYEIDNNASYLCIDLGDNVLPTVYIYKIETGEEIKRVSYEPYRDKGMYAKKISYENGAFIVTFSADTHLFTRLKIPIDIGKNYQIIEKYPP